MIPPILAYLLLNKGEKSLYTSATELGRMLKNLDIQKQEPSKAPQIIDQNKGK